jgi:hypothetical protein
MKKIKNKNIMACTADMRPGSLGHTAGVRFLSFQIFF